MIKHIFTLIWNKKRKNFLLFLEILFAFLILFAVFTVVTRNLRIYWSPLGYNTVGIMNSNLTYEEDMDSTELADMKLLLKRELEQLPQIESVSYTNTVIPFGTSIWTTVSDANGFQLRTHISQTDEDYLETLEMEIVEGRWYNEEDRLAKYPPIVLNERMRREYFKDDPILDSVYNINGEHRIVGVVRNYKYEGEFRPESNMTFFMRPEHHPDLRTVHIRLRPGTGPAFEQTVNRLIADITKKNDFTIDYMETRRVRRSRTVWIPMIALLSISGFLIINVALGLFGVLWYTISNHQQAAFGDRPAPGHGWFRRNDHLSVRGGSAYGGPAWIGTRPLFCPPVSLAQRF